MTKDDNIRYARSNLENSLKNNNTKLAPLIPWKFIIIPHLLVIVVSVPTVLLSYWGLFPFILPLGIYRYLPGDILVDIIWVYILSLIIGSLLYFVTPLLSLLFWKVHNPLNLKHYNYYIQTLNSNLTLKDQLKRLFVPAFVALGVSSSLINVPPIIDFIIVTETFFTTMGLPVITGLSIFFIMMLFASFVMILITPIWLLEDAGIICERKTAGKRITSDIEGVGNWYLALLKGFAGITTILAYIFMSIQVIEWYQIEYQFVEFESYVFFLLIPVIVILLSPLIAIAPISGIHIFYEFSLKRNVSLLQAKMISKGLKKVEVVLKEVSD
ncbi:MAG: hypothetical protein ACFFCZ_24530 [Promethearchaeota archaeon]